MAAFAFTFLVFSRMNGPSRKLNVVGKCSLIATRTTFGKEATTGCPATKVTTTKATSLPTFPWNCCETTNRTCLPTSPWSYSTKMVISAAAAEEEVEEEETAMDGTDHREVEEDEEGEVADLRVVACAMMGVVQRHPHLLLPLISMETMDEMLLLAGRDGIKVVMVVKEVIEKCGRVEVEEK